MSDISSDFPLKLIYLFILKEERPISMEIALRQGCLSTRNATNLVNNMLEKGTVHERLLIYCYILFSLLSKELRVIVPLSLPHNHPVRKVRLEEIN